MVKTTVLPEALGAKFTAELNFRIGDTVEVISQGHAEIFVGCSDLRVAFFSVDEAVVSLLTVKNKGGIAVFHDWSGVVVRAQPVGEMQLA